MPKGERTFHVPEDRQVPQIPSYTRFRFLRLHVNEIIIQLAAVGLNGAQITQELRQRGSRVGAMYVAGYLRTPECLKGVREFQDRHNGQTVARVLTRLAGTQEANIGTLEDIRDGNMVPDPDGTPIRERREAAQFLTKSFLNVAIGKSGGEESREREERVNALIASQAIELRQALSEESGEPLQDGEYREVKEAAEKPSPRPRPLQMEDPESLSRELRRNRPPRYVEV